MKPFIRFFLMASTVGANGYFGTVLFNHALELLTQFALLLVVGIGLWVFGWLMVIRRMQASRNQTIHLMGEALGAGFIYTALFQGLIYSVVVFWVIGTATSFGELPESTAQFAYDLILGSGYLSILILGGSGCTITLTYHRPLKKLKGLLLAVAGIGLPLFLFLAFRESVKTFVFRSPSLAIGMAGTYYMLFSIFAMSVLATAPPDQAYLDIRKRKAKLRHLRKKANS